MIYVLIIASCLGASCKKEVVADGFTLMSCQTASQIIAAQWQATHPNRTITKLRCVPAPQVVSELKRDWS